MVRFASLSVILLLLLAGCSAARRSERAAAPTGNLKIMVPPPTHVQFFPSPKPVSVYAGTKNGAYAADVRFKVVDADGHTDYFGDDDQTLKANVNLQANQSGTYQIYEPTYRRVNGTSDPAADVNVDYPYRTTQMWFTAEVGGNYPPGPAMIEVDDTAHDDMVGDTLEVRFVALGGGKTRIDVTVVILDGSGHPYSRTGSTTVTPP